MSSTGIEFHRALTRLENSSIDFIHVIPKHDNVLVTASKNHPIITLWDIIQTSTTTTTDDNNSLKTLLVMRGQLTNWSKSSEIKLTDICLTICGESIISSYNDGSIRIWNWQTFECKKVLNGHLDSVLSIDCSLDGSLIISSSRDNTMRLWSVSGGQCLKKLNSNSKDSHSDIVKMVRFIKNWAGQTQAILDENGNSIISENETPISDNYQFVSLGNSDGCMKLWQVENQSKLISQANLEGKFDGEKFLLTPDGSFFSLAGSLNKVELIEVIVTTQPCEFKHLYDCCLKNSYDTNLYDYYGNSEEGKKETKPVTCIDMCYSPNRYWLSLLQSNGMLCTIDLESKTIVHHQLIGKNNSKSFKIGRAHV